MSLDQLIENNDPDPLIREISALCNARNWRGVMEIRDRCEQATERGKTLWGVAEHAAYRIALEAPGQFAGHALDTKTGPLAIGPLPEVAASTHTWEELAPHVEEGPLRGLTAYECVALGEDLSDDASLAEHRTAFELPLRLFPWEPEYPKAEYLEDGANFPAPRVDVVQQRAITDQHGDFVDDLMTIESWRALVSPWVEQSNGWARVFITEGEVDSAIQQVDQEITTVTQITTSSALQWMCWAASSGGAYGRRRGLAAGRAMTWLTLADACDLLDDEMPTGDEIGERLEGLQWWTWNEVDFSENWNLRLAVHDPVEGTTIAINAQDSTDQFAS